jgi:hypothetical protein
MFFGAEFTAAYAHRYSGHVPPSDIAKSTPPIENYSEKIK